MSNTTRRDGPGRTLAPIGLARTLSSPIKPAGTPIIPPLVETTAATSSASLVGQTIDGRYLIDREIGRGGMGVVYAATHIDLDKKVAIKVLAEEYRHDPAIRRRFAREPQAAAAIGHKNIVDVNDTGRTESDDLYFVMEYLDGHPLAADLIIEDGDGVTHGIALPWARSQRILLQICDALMAAHAAGIIHRDIKAENIFLITKDGTPDFVKVIDFGIVKDKRRDRASGSTTEVGITTGTPEYMSPEQATTGAEVDTRTDIYSFGILMYQMLCGDVPFRSQNKIEVLHMHLKNKPRPPREINPDIPKEVEAIILRALEKNPEERFQTMAEVKEAITAAGIAACQEIPIEVTVGNVQKGRWWLSIAAGIGAVLLGVAVGRGILYPKVAKDRNVIIQMIPSPRPDARQQTHTISIRTEPAGARVLKGTEELGITPFSIEVPASKTPMHITLRLDGHIDERMNVTPDADQHISIALRPIASQAESLKSSGNGPAGKNNRTPREGRGPSKTVEIETAE